MNNSLILVLMAGILANNYAIQNFLGVDSILSNGSSVKKSLRLGGFVTLIMVISAVITWPLQTYVLKHAEYLQTLAFVTVILIVAAAVEKIAGKSPDRDFLLFAVNGAVLGLCIRNVQTSFAEAIFAAVGAGLGFMAAMAVFASLRDRVEEEEVPEAFRGLPVSLLIVSMMSLALFAF